MRCVDLKRVLVELLRGFVCVYFSTIILPRVPKTPTPLASFPSLRFARRRPAWLISCLRCAGVMPASSPSCSISQLSPTSNLLVLLPAVIALAPVSHRRRRKKASTCLSLSRPSACQPRNSHRFYALIPLLYALPAVCLLCSSVSLFRFPLHDEEGERKSDERGVMRGEDLSYHRPHLLPLPSGTKTLQPRIVFSLFISLVSISGLVISLEPLSGLIRRPRIIFLPCHHYLCLIIIRHWPLV